MDKKQLNKKMIHVLVWDLGSRLKQWASSWKLSQSERTGEMISKLIGLRSVNIVEMASFLFPSLPYI